VPCGNGRLSFELAKRGLSVTGMDISEEFIEEARASIRSLVNPSAHALVLTPQQELLTSSARLHSGRQSARLQGNTSTTAPFVSAIVLAFLEYDDMETVSQGAWLARSDRARVSSWKRHGPPNLSCLILKSRLATRSAIITLTHQRAIQRGRGMHR
jgi:hypothetical protein